MPVSVENAPPAIIGSPNLSWFVAQVKNLFPILGKTLDLYMEELTREPDYSAEADGLVKGAFRLGQAVGLSADEVLDAYADFCFTFLREQEEFLKTGAYRNTDAGFDAVRTEVYENDAYMKNYMLGHYLTCAVFPHHYRQYRFYKDRFVATAPDSGCLFEFGLGHGLWTTLFLAHSRSRRASACDISPTCVDLASRHTNLEGIGADRVDIVHADAVKHDLGGREFDALIASGLLEHIEDPEMFLRRIRPNLRPGTGRLFTMVPTNTALPDHLVLFTRIEEIQKMFRRAGYTPVEECIVHAGLTEKQNDDSSMVHLGIFARAA